MWLSVWDMICCSALFEARVSRMVVGGEDISAGPIGIGYGGGRVRGGWGREWDESTINNDGRVICVLASSRSFYFNFLSERDGVG